MALALEIASSIKIAKKSMKQPIETAFIIEESSSNLERTNQCSYNPEKENIITQ